MDRGASDQARQLRSLLDQKLQEHDQTGAISEALSAVRSGRIGLVELYENVLIPLMVDIGTRWQSQKAEIWEEHLASATVRAIVENLFGEVMRSRARTAGQTRSVLLACPPEEQHDLGLRMLADRFRILGWTAHFLGADVPKDQIIAAADTLGVDAVVLSAATHFHRLHLRELIDDLHCRLPQIRIWVEGAAFHQNHDGWEDAEILDIDALFGQKRGGG